MQLDKICPACKKPIKQRKQGACPECGVALFIDSQKLLRRESDKNAVNQLIVLLQMHIRQRNDIYVDMMAERKFGYILLDKTREFHAKNEYIGLSPEEMFIQTFNFMLADKWWGTHLETCRMLLNSWTSTSLIKFYKQKRIEYTKVEAEKKRIMSGTKQLSLQVDYAIA